MEAGGGIARRAHGGRTYEVAIQQAQSRARQRRVDTATGAALSHRLGILDAIKRRRGGLLFCRSIAAGGNCAHGCIEACSGRSRRGASSSRNRTLDSRPLGIAALEPRPSRARSACNLVPSGRLQGGT